MMINDRRSTKVLLMYAEMGSMVVKNAGKFPEKRRAIAAVLGDHSC